MKSLNFLVDIVPYQSFKAIQKISSRSMKHWHETHICQQDLEQNSIKIKSGNFLKLLAPEAMKLLGVC